MIKAKIFDHLADFLAYLRSFVIGEGQGEVRKQDELCFGTDFDWLREFGDPATHFHHERNRCRCWIGTRRLLLQLQTRLLIGLLCHQLLRCHSTLTVNTCVILGPFVHWTGRLQNIIWEGLRRQRLLQRHVLVRLLYVIEVQNPAQYLLVLFHVRAPAHEHLTSSRIVSIITHRFRILNLVALSVCSIAFCSFDLFADYRFFVGDGWRSLQVNLAWQSYIVVRACLVFAEADRRDQFRCSF